MAYDYQGELNKLKTAQKNAAVADLENTRNQALSNLKAEQAQNAGSYNQQRSTANVQNRMNSKNFQEYLASTGRANTGLTGQAKMQYDNNLTTSLNTLNAGEAAALADINRRTTDTHNAYNSGLASANANIEANYIQSLLNERAKELERQMQEKQYQESIRQFNANKALQDRQFAESVRQFNENLALQKAQLQSRFSSGSGGGSSRSSYSGGGSSSGGINWSNTNNNLSGDAKKYGTFSNGYQPKGISGHGALSKSGDKITINGKTQNVWKAKDGTKWYWDGNKRTYIAMPTVAKMGGR